MARIIDGYLIRKESWYYDKGIDRNIYSEEDIRIVFTKWEADSIISTAEDEEIYVDPMKYERIPYHDGTGVELKYIGDDKDQYHLNYKIYYEEHQIVIV